MSDIAVSIPARPDFVHVLRSVMASVAARLSFAFDEIDDLRLAVDEACAQLLAARPGKEGRLTLKIAPNDGALSVTAYVEPVNAEWPPPGSRQMLAWQVLGALVEQVEFDRANGGIEVRFTKRRS